MKGAWRPRSGPSGRLVALAVVTLLVVAGLAYAFTRPRLEEAPPFRLQVAGQGEGGMPGNGTIDLVAARGKVVVLDFMAVNCAACRVLTKQVLHPLWQEHGANASFELWSIDVWAGLPGQVGETEADLLAIQEQEDAPWPHALDDGSVYAAYRPVALPQLAVVDPQGRIVFHSNAPDLPSLADVRQAVADAQTGDARAVGIPQGGLAGLALLAGAAAVFSPCSVGLLPAYFGMLLRSRRPGPGAGLAVAVAAGSPVGPTSGAPTVGSQAAAASGQAAGGSHAAADPALPLHDGRSPVGPVWGGLQTTAGVVVVYGVIALALLPFGGVLLPLVPKLGIAMGVLFILLGAAMLLGFDWSRFTRNTGLGRFAPDGSRRGYWLFGLAYAFASFGCTGPVFLPLLFTSFAAGPLVGLGVFALYAAGIAVLLVLVALMASLGADGPLRRLAAKGVWVTRSVAVLWIAAGIYLFAYDLYAFS